MPGGGAGEREDNARTPGAPEREAMAGHQSAVRRRDGEAARQALAAGH
ncbi:hypothetical protein STTU_4578 [Streptomyces sp. Tu6071]|nr:hypothetical protein STTU_4578 [Streptomyces sp. Tu6071]